MKLSKIGLILAGIYLFITAIVIFYMFTCGGLFCGLVTIYTVYPEYLLVTITGLYKSIADPINPLFFPVSIAINTLWLYFIGSFVFEKGYKNDRSKINTVLLFVIATLPIIIIIISYIYGSVLNYRYEQSEKNLNINQKAQILVAKNSNITIEAGTTTITKIAETAKNDEYKLVTQLKINNVPNELERYNIQCKGASSQKEGYIISSGNYPDLIYLNDTYTNDVNFLCGFLLARKNEGSWQYGVDTWNRTHKDSPELVSYLVLKHGESLPILNSFDIFLYIPVKPEQVTPYPEPQGVSQAESTILSTNLVINQPKRITN